MSDEHIKGYTRAITSQFPELAVHSIEYLSEGWDSVACKVNDNLIFRFPKRADVEASLKAEIRILPSLAAALPLPIPNFKYVSLAPTADFERAFVGYEMIAGESYEDEWPVEVGTADWWKQPVADFLTALHAFPIAKAQELGAIFRIANGLPLKSGFSDWHSVVADYYQDVQKRAFNLLSDEQQAGVRLRFETFLAAKSNFEFEPVLLHADFSPDHVLVDITKQQVTGIIDFGDMAIGDPAWDVWPSLDSYYKGQISENFQARREFYAYLREFVMLTFGQTYHDPALVEYGMIALVFK